MARPTDFYETPDYDNARGIAEALRGHCCTLWQLMHEARRGAHGPWAPFEWEWRQNLPTLYERELRRLLGIRREGMGR